jgi:hypothetical protein
MRQEVHGRVGLPLVGLEAEWQMPIRLAGPRTGGEVWRIVRANNCLGSRGPNP